MRQEIISSISRGLPAAQTGCFTKPIVRDEDRIRLDDNVVTDTGINVDELMECCRVCEAACAVPVLSVETTESVLLGQRGAAMDG